MRKITDQARRWLANYHGSIDATALLLAFDAGRESAARTAARYVWNPDWNPDHGNVIATRIREGE